MPRMALPKTCTRLPWLGDSYIWLILLLYRILNAVSLETAFVPDEYWQSLEIAHLHVFGYGYETWEWKERIRGYFFPAMFMVLYNFLRATGMDTPVACVHAPRILQG